MSQKKLLKLWIYHPQTRILHLLLVLTPIVKLLMALNDLKKELKNLKFQDSSRINFSLKKEVILCKHCKRTKSNGIRCLGMCVADNDY